jgi:tRNA threonylcarbamoyladenosine biosynthesis protein TsaE
MVEITQSEKETLVFGKKIARCLDRGAVIALHGDLGSGKTTLTKGLVAGLFPRKKITVKSPSFALVNQYQGAYPVYHIDCYRLEDAEDLEQIGIDEFMYGSGISIIEWPEKISRLLPPETLHIYITALHETARGFLVRGRSELLEKIRRRVNV